MNVCGLIVREIGHRWLNFGLGLVAIVTAVTLYVAFSTADEGAARETRRLMRDMGFNLRIIPRETDMVRFWSSGYADHTMPEEDVQRLAAQEGLSYAHLSATLQRRFAWQGREIVLTGIQPEVAPPGTAKTPMYTPVEPGHALVGAAVAAELELEQGDEIQLDGVPLTVERCLVDSGSLDDIRVYIHLRDAQRILGLEGRINEIRALQCLCIGQESAQDPLSELQAQLAQVLPQAKVVRMQAIADAREQQRVLMHRLSAFVLPLVVVVCLVWIGVLALLNVRERAGEIGILRALGHGAAYITALFLGRAVLMGVVGAVAGFGLGTALALWTGPRIFTVTAAALEPSAGLLLVALWAAPLFCAVAALVPTAWGVTRDPAQILREG